MGVVFFEMWRPPFATAPRPSLGESAWPGQDCPQGYGTSGCVPALSCMVIVWRSVGATRALRLGKLVLPTTLSSEAIKDLANMPKEFLQKVQERLPEAGSSAATSKIHIPTLLRQAPPEAAKILASLLQEDPEARCSRTVSQVWHCDAATIPFNHRRVATAVRSVRDCQ